MIQNELKRSQGKNFFKFFNPIKKCSWYFQDSFIGAVLLLNDTIKLVKTHMVPFSNKLKHVKKGLKVKIFLNFFRTYKEVRQVADIFTTNLRFKKELIPE